jgi:NAD(P)H dehydrogenase (quinone)
MKEAARVRIVVIFYSMYGHTWKMAEAVVKGAGEVEGAEVLLYQVAELVPDDILERSGAKKLREQFAHIPTAGVEVMRDADAVIIGTPTRYGNMAAQMRNFLDQSGPLFAANALVGKIGSVFTSSATQHGGQETTIISTHFTMLHLGMIIVGVPYSEKRISTMDEISGGSPYGASTIVGHGLPDRPTPNELEVARFQGRHVAEIARDLARGRKAK